MENNFDFLDSYNATQDIPDPRDITTDDLELLGASQIPDFVHHKNTPILSQGAIGACTIF